ncbi:PepSY domain-containing protein [Corynebacterium sp. c24Ua_83]|uniref:PepSY domain-containing protein n=1 Tax=Corynebacterium sp. c24Ua_83 TaxID=3032350 RepID=UPI003265F178
MSRRIIRRVHTLAGLFIAPLILVAAFSGFFYALAPTIETWVYKSELTATSSSPAQPVAKQIEAAKRIHPDLDVAKVQIPDEAGKTTRVLFADPTLPSESYNRAVFVDPGDLHITGELTQYGSTSSLPFRAWLSEGHRNLWLDEPGRIYSETAATWLGPMAVTGVAMWWFMRKQKNQRKPKKKSRRQAMQRHTLIGLVAAPGLIFLCISGLTWSHFAGDNIAAVREELNWMAPEPNTSISGEQSAQDSGSGHEGQGEHAGHAGHTGHGSTAEIDMAQADTALQVGRNEGLTGTLQLAPPSAPGQAWTVSEPRQAYKMHNDAITVNGENGEVIDRLPFSSWPIAAQLTSWIIQLHMGTLFGLVSQIALALLALGIGALVVYGYIMWWRRRGGKTNGARVVLRELSWKHWVALGILLGGYSMIAPLFAVSGAILFGISLALDFLGGKKTGRPNAAAEGTQDTGLGGEKKVPVTAESH